MSKKKKKKKGKRSLFVVRARMVDTGRILSFESSDKSQANEFAHGCESRGFAVAMAWPNGATIYRSPWETLAATSF